MHELVHIWGKKPNWNHQWIVIVLYRINKRMNFRETEGLHCSFYRKIKHDAKKIA